MSKLNLSIITIAFNNTEELVETLGSIDIQDSSYLENILILSGFSDIDKNMILRDFNNEKRHFYWDLDNSLFNAMNIGIEKSKGEYILFLNAGDCFINNNSLSEVKEISKKQECLSFKTV